MINLAADLPGIICLAFDKSTVFEEFIEILTRL